MSKLKSGASYNLTPLTVTPPVETGGGASGGGGVPAIAGTNMVIDSTTVQGSQIFNVVDKFACSRYSATLSEWIGYTSISTGISALLTGEILALNQALSNFSVATIDRGIISGNNSTISLVTPLTLSGDVIIRDAIITRSATANNITIGATTTPFSVTFINCKFLVDLTVNSTATLTLKDCSFAPSYRITSNGFLTVSGSTNLFGVSIYATPSTPINFFKDQRSGIKVMGLYAQTLDLPCELSTVSNEVLPIADQYTLGCTFYGSNAGVSSLQSFYNTFIGYKSGNVDQTGYSNTFIGAATGQFALNTTDNTIIGSEAGNFTTTGASNTYIGSSAARNATTASNNIVIGAVSAFNMTTANTSIIIGSNACYTLTTASSNTVIGNTAGYFLNSSLNTLIGNQAGRFGTILTQVVAVGHQAGFNTNAIGTTYVGFQAGRSNTTAGHSTFIGHQAGVLATTGLQNTFIGAAAGGACTTGGQGVAVGYQTNVGSTASGSTSVGYQAGKALTIGAFNTFIGNSSGIITTTGNQNTALGRNSGFRLITGNNNTFIGHAAGEYSSSGENNVAIGVNAGPSINNSGISNSIAIGTGAVTTMSDTLLLGGLGPFAVNVGIGTDAPTSKLQVVGVIHSSLNGFKFPDGTVQISAVTSLQLTTQQASATQAANYTLVLSDAGRIVPFSTLATCTIPAGTYPVGTVIEIGQEGTGQVTIAGDTGVTLHFFGGVKTAGQWASVKIRQRALNEWVITGGVV